MSKTYRSLSPQPISVYFSLQGIITGVRPLSKVDNQLRVDTSPRPIEVRMKIANRWYGPYLTDVTASPDDFIKRWQLNPTKQQRRLKIALRNWDEWVISAWAEMLPSGEIITGDAIWKEVGKPENRQPVSVYTFS